MTVSEELRRKREELVIEHMESENRVYFDSNTVLRQLGIAHDPLSTTGRIATALNHPLTVGRALTRQLIRR